MVTDVLFEGNLSLDNLVKNMNVIGDHPITDTDPVKVLSILLSQLPKIELVNKYDVVNEYSLTIERTKDDEELEIIPKYDLQEVIITSGVREFEKYNRYEYGVTKDRVTISPDGRATNLIIYLKPRIRKH